MFPLGNNKMENITDHIILLLLETVSPFSLIKVSNYLFIVIYLVIVALKSSCFAHFCELVCT